MSAVAVGFCFIGFGCVGDSYRRYTSDSFPFFQLFAWPRTLKIPPLGFDLGVSDGREGRIRAGSVSFGLFDFLLSCSLFDSLGFVPDSSDPDICSVAPFLGPLDLREELWLVCDGDEFSLIFDDSYC
ncbi:hypothetical protein B296_00043560 [Ensete ventricosum]|uniref:Uncharacterized protein n=1 Tax=Ensete ventricosum TaxID=4639 RepID=A0A426YI74_ENSVE|nr:hypothetical protein B296_00043560 [Ensete ventricosum]